MKFKFKFLRINYPIYYYRFSIYISFVQVTYDTTGFLEKNRDTLSVDIIETMQASSKKPETSCINERILLSKYSMINNNTKLYYEDVVVHLFFYLKFL